MARYGLLPTVQPADGVTYAHKIDKAEGLIDWRLPAEVIARRVRAFDPFPGASTASPARLVKVWRAGAVPLRSGAAPGTVLEVDGNGITVACGEGALCLCELQRAGGKRLPAREFLQGQPDWVGQRLGEPSACE